MSAEVRNTSDFEQPPSHFMRVGFENYPEYLRTRQNQTRDPLNPDFNIWYWCGIKNDEERQTIANQYHNFIQMIPEEFYNGDPTAVEALIANGTLTPQVGEIVKMNIRFLFRDAIDRNPWDNGNITPFPQPEQARANQTRKRMIFRVLFAIYAKEAENGLWFVNGEQFLCNQILNMVDLINLNLNNRGTNINRTDIAHGMSVSEALAYSIYLNCVIKTPMKQMLFPCLASRESGTYDHLLNLLNVDNLHPVDKLRPDLFFNWLICLLIIKKYKNTFSRLINLPTKQRNAFYSVFISTFTQWGPNEGQAFLVAPTFGPEPDSVAYLINIYKIFGDLLVSKDITQFIAYIASYWCSYLSPENQLDNKWQELQDMVVARPGQEEDMMAEYVQIYVTHLLRQNVYANPIDRNEFNRIYNYFKKLKKQGGLTTDKRLSAPVAAKQRTKFEDLVLLCVNKSWKKGKQVAGQSLFSFPKKYINSSAIWDVPPVVAPVAGDGGDGRDDGRRDGGDVPGRDGVDDGDESTRVEPRTPPTSPPSESGDDRLSTIPEETETESDTTSADSETSSTTGAVAGAGTPYFGSRRQTFFIRPWEQWSGRNVGTPPALALGDFQNLAVAVAGGDASQRNSRTFVPFLYLVGNLNGGNYDLTQGVSASGAPVNWLEGSYAQGSNNYTRLQAAAAAYSAWAQANEPRLLQLLNQFLTNVTIDPRSIPIGTTRGRNRQGGYKKRKRYKTLKKSKRKLNRTIRLR